ncbi:sugar ABC transporter permease, partial [Streptomyces sp. SID5785]|uniref:carbohydrate ABC transporter permease n=1 Tax=Streptomyces sp. SID5785 TaxID=2690309 RepID=UPI0013610935
MSSIATRQRTAPAAPATAAKASGPRLSRKHREWLAAGLFLLPDSLGLFLFVLLPMLFSVVLSFFQVSGFGSYTWIGLGNYQRMIDDPYFWSSMWITAKYVVILVPVLFVVSLGLGVLMKQKLPGMAAYRTALFMPYMLSLVVAGLLWKFMFDEQTGIANKAVGEL